MATRQTINRISERIDELAARMGAHRGPVYLVVGDSTEAPAVIDRHLEQFPRDRVCKMIVITTGVPRTADFWAAMTIKS